MVLTVKELIMEIRFLLQLQIRFNNYYPPPKTATLKTVLIPCHSVNHKEMVLWAIV